MTTPAEETDRTDERADDQTMSDETKPRKKPTPSPLKPGAIQLYGVKEAAEYCKLAARTIKYHIYESGELQADALIGHSLVFTQETLEDFLARRRPVGRPKGSRNKEEEDASE